MHRIVVFEESETTFVREGSFVLPAFDGEAKFSLEAALVGVGGKRIGQGDTWNVPLSIPELAEYLSLLQSASDAILVRKQWARKHCIRSMVDAIPFNNGKIDWRAFAQQIESMVAKEFPLCV